MALTKRDIWEALARAPLRSGKRLNQIEAAECVEFVLEQMKKSIIENGYIELRDFCVIDSGVKRMRRWPVWLPKEQAAAEMEREVPFVRFQGSDELLRQVWEKHRPGQQPFQRRYDKSRNLIANRKNGKRGAGNGKRGEEC